MSDIPPRRRRAQMPAPETSSPVENAPIQDDFPEDMPFPEGNPFSKADTPLDTPFSDGPEADFSDEQPFRPSLGMRLHAHITYMHLPSRPLWHVHSLHDFGNWLIDWLAFPWKVLGAFLLYWLYYLRSAIRYFFEPLSSRIPSIRRTFWRRVGCILLVLLTAFGLLGAIAFAQPLLLLLCLLPLPVLLWRYYRVRQHRKELRHLQQKGIHLQLPIYALIPAPTKPHHAPMHLLSFRTVHPRTGTPIALYSEPISGHFTLGELVHVILHPTDEDIYHIDVSTPVPKHFSFHRQHAGKKKTPSQRTIQRKLRRTMNTATPERVKKEGSD